MIMCMSDILCVTNRRLCREDFLRRIGQIASCHPAGIILREKDLTPREYRALARQVMAICEKHGVLCILHNFADVAQELGAKAIHLPLPVLDSLSQKEKSRFQVIGASCHTVAEAQAAERLGCSYISAGHVFETECKMGLPGRGLDFLREVCNCVSIPVYGIGGINGDNIMQVRAAGAGGACLMSSLMAAGDPAALLRAVGEKK